MHADKQILKHIILESNRSAKLMVSVVCPKNRVLDERINRSVLAVPNLEGLVHFVPTRVHDNSFESLQGSLKNS